MKKFEIGRVKNHDYDTFIKVINLAYYHNYIPNFRIIYCFTLEKMVLVVLHYGLLISLLGSFNNNMKQVI